MNITKLVPKGDSVYSLECNPNEPDLQIFKQASSILGTPKTKPLLLKLHPATRADADRFPKKPLFEIMGDDENDTRFRRPKAEEMQRIAEILGSLGHDRAADFKELPKGDLKATLQELVLNFGTAADAFITFEKRKRSLRQMEALLHQPHMLRFADSMLNLVTYLDAAVKKLALRDPNEPARDFHQRLEHLLTQGQALWARIFTMI